MESQIDDLFDGYAIELTIPGSHHSPAQAEAIRKAMKGLNPQKLRYNCVVAESLNICLGGGPKGTPPEEYGEFDVGDRTFQLNCKGKSQFGMDQNGKPYLTTSLVDVELDTRYSFTWRGDDIPRELLETAVLHDEGKDTAPIEISLSFDLASKHIVGHKSSPNDRRRNHDTDKNGQPYKRRPRPHHNRVCRTDLDWMPAENGGGGTDTLVRPKMRRKAAKRN
jgi:hypothetical protein